MNPPLPGAPGEKVASASVWPYIAKLLRRGSVLLPLDVAPAWPHNHILRSFPLLPGISHIIQESGRSVQKTLSPVSLHFQPISLLDFGFSLTWETKHLEHLVVVACFMAGGAADSCFSRLHLRSGRSCDQCPPPTTSQFTQKLCLG